MSLLSLYYCVDLGQAVISKAGMVVIMMMMIATPYCYCEN